MKSYLLSLKTPKSGIFVFMLKYNEEGELIYAEIRDFNMKLSDKQRDWIWTFIPKYIDELNERKSINGCTINPIETDLGFDAFWELYNYKVGNKKRAKKHWDTLDTATRALAMKQVKAYNFHMAHKTHDKVFPERWLQQERYNNEFIKSR